MFLKRRSTNGNDEGAAMVAVLGLMSVTAIIAVTVSASTLQAMGTTTSTRAGIQAHAAAEAGVAQALVHLESTCNPTFSSPSGPDYDYRMEFSMSSVSPTWQIGCPPDDASLIKIVSTGFATARGVAGASSGDEVTLEAIYSWIPIYVEVPVIEPAVYAHTMEGVFKNFVLTSPSESLSADVMIKNGNVICENGATIDGSVILGNGYVKLNRCDVDGNIHVSQWVEMAGNDTLVNGDIIALGQGVGTGTDVVKIASGVDKVVGSVYAGGDIQVGDRVDGSVTLVGTPANRVRVGGSVGGDVISSGSATISGSVSGSVSTNVTGMATLPVPRVPDWTDIPYPTSAWDAFTEVMWQGSCNIGNSHAFWNELASKTASTGNIVVNALSCGAPGLDFQNNIKDLKLHANVVFVAWKFNIDRLKTESNNATPRDLWFMVPDNNANQQPTCSGLAGGIKLTNEADFHHTVSAMVYTPCKITSDRNHWRGQFYGGTVEFLQQAIMTYEQVGVPGVDFDSSLPPILALDDAKLGSLISVRQVG